MKVYFACSIRGGRDDAETYARLVDHIKTKTELLSEIFADGTLTAQGSAGKSSDIYAQDIAWIKEADLIIAEVSNPSLGVGYEIATAEALKKPVLILYRPSPERRLSAMIDGSPHVIICNYKNMIQAYRAIDAFIYSNSM